MHRKFITLVLIVILIATIPVLTFAHPGRTDSSGGHHDYSNASGLGSYHYHHGYGPHLHDGGVCPYDNTDVPSSNDELTYYQIQNKTLEAEIQNKEWYINSLEEKLTTIARNSALLGSTGGLIVGLIAGRLVSSKRKKK